MRKMIRRKKSPEKTCLKIFIKLKSEEIDSIQKPQFVRKMHKVEWHFFTHKFSFLNTLYLLGF